MMGIAEELRTLAGAWDEWGLGGKLTELAERLERQEGVSDEDAEAAKWVREHGGLNDVSSSFDWCTLTTKRLFHMAFPGEGDCEFIAVGDCFAELDRRLMPTGMEWLRTETGEPVTLGDQLMDDDELEGWREVDTIIFQRTDGGYTIEIENDRGVSQLYEPGERVKRPKPAPVCADGVPVVTGDMVWYATSGREMVVDAVEHRPDGWWAISKFRDGSVKDSAPVSVLTHTKPEPPDSWEQLEEDAKKRYEDYWGCVDKSCDNCPAIVDGKTPDERFGALRYECRKAMSADLVRRAKALAERDGK